MKKSGHILWSVLLAMGAGAMIQSCESSSTIGSVLTTDEVTIVVDSAYTMTGHSVDVDAVLSRTVVQLIGKIDAPDYGYITSDVVSQFMPASVIDTTGVTVNDIDSLKLVMLVNTASYVGDTLAIMGMEAYPLIKQLEVPIYSNTSPEGMYDPENMLGSLVYNLTKAIEPDSLQSNSYYTLSMDLPVELGRKFFNEYVENPATFSSPISFAKFFPGIYLKNSYGSGRITRIGNTTMQMYYRKKGETSEGNDTTYTQVGNYFAVTPEIITNNHIELTMAESVKDRVAQGESVLLAPAGLNVELVFPGKEIVSRYRGGTQSALGVVNQLALTLPIEAIENKYDISAPTDVLLILKKDADSFFINNELPDNVTSFRATLTTFSDNTQAYVFSDMRQYILQLLEKNTITDDDVTFVLVPVTVTTESNNDYYGNSTAVVTAVTPYVSEPKMTNVLLDKAKIIFVYSLQTANYY